MYSHEIEQSQHDRLFSGPMDLETQAPEDKNLMGAIDALRILEGILVEKDANPEVLKHVADCMTACEQIMKDV